MQLAATAHVYLKAAAERALQRAKLLPFNEDPDLCRLPRGASTNHHKAARLHYCDSLLSLVQGADPWQAAQRKHMPGRWWRGNEQDVKDTEAGAKRLRRRPPPLWQQCLFASAHPLIARAMRADWSLNRLAALAQRVHRAQATEVKKTIAGDFAHYAVAHEQEAHKAVRLPDGDPERLLDPAIEWREEYPDGSRRCYSSTGYEVKLQRRRQKLCGLATRVIPHISKFGGKGGTSRWRLRQEARVLLRIRPEFHAGSSDRGVYAFSSKPDVCRRNQRAVAATEATATAQQAAFRAYFH